MPKTIKGTSDRRVTRNMMRFGLRFQLNQNQVYGLYNSSVRIRVNLQAEVLAALLAPPRIIQRRHSVTVENAQRVPPAQELVQRPAPAPAIAPGLAIVQAPAAPARRNSISTTHGIAFNPPSRADMLQQFGLQQLMNLDSDDDEMEAVGGDENNVDISMEAVGGDANNVDEQMEAVGGEGHHNDTEMVAAPAKGLIGDDDLDWNADWMKQHDFEDEENEGTAVTDELLDDEMDFSAVVTPDSSEFEADMEEPTMKSNDTEKENNLNVANVILANVIQLAVIEPAVIKPAVIGPVVIEPVVIEPVVIEPVVIPATVIPPVIPFKIRGRRPSENFQMQLDSIIESIE